MWLVHLNTVVRQVLLIWEITCFNDTVNIPFSTKVTNLLPGFISKSNLLFFFLLIWHPFVRQELLIIEPSRSHSDTLHPTELLWTSDHRMQRPLPDNIQHSQDRDLHNLRRDSNPQSQQVSGHRPTSYGNRDGHSPSYGKGSREFAWRLHSFVCVVFFFLFFTSFGFSPCRSRTVLCKTLSNLLLSERYIQWQLQFRLLLFFPSSSLHVSRWLV